MTFPSEFSLDLMYKIGDHKTEQFLLDLPYYFLLLLYLDYLREPPPEPAPQQEAALLAVLASPSAHE